MGDFLMPPYIWYTKKEDSTLDPHRSGLVEENKEKQQASISKQTKGQQGHSSTLDSHRSEFVEERVNEQKDPRTPDPDIGWG